MKKTKKRFLMTLAILICLLTVSGIFTYAKAFAIAPAKDENIHKFNPRLIEKEKYPILDRFWPNTQPIIKPQYPLRHGLVVFPKPIEKETYPSLDRFWPNFKFIVKEKYPLLDRARLNPYVIEKVQVDLVKERSCPASDDIHKQTFPSPDEPKPNPIPIDKSTGSLVKGK